ncbi:MAG: putative transposase [Methyloprofundus sp.]|nr:MAG: putative transposase [Methyloprofundus sp.]
MRKGRFSTVQQAYFVTTVLADRQQAIFNDFACARLLILHMRTLHESKHISSIAWVVMPDHIHWLFQLQDKKPLAEVMRLFKAGAAYKINCHLNRKGALWQKYYYDHALREEEDIQAIARYIVANPLRAKLVTQISDYPHWDAIWLP